jgi:hypothetical protein
VLRLHASNLVEQDIDRDDKAWCSDAIAGRSGGRLVGRLRGTCARRS